MNRKATSPNCLERHFHVKSQGIIPTGNLIIKFIKQGMQIMLFLVDTHLSKVIKTLHQLKKVAWVVSEMMDKVNRA